MKKIAEFYGMDIDLEFAIKRAIEIHEEYDHYYFRGMTEKDDEISLVIRFECYREGYQRRGNIGECDYKIMIKPNSKKGYDITIMQEENKTPDEFPGIKILEIIYHHKYYEPFMEEKYLEMYRD